MQTLEYAHIVQEADGKWFIRGTRFKLLMLIRAHLAHDWDAPELQAQYPQLTLAQIHAALGFYYEHRDEMDAEIRRGDEFAAKMRAEQGETPLRQSLLEAKRRAIESRNVGTAQ